MFHYIPCILWHIVSTHQSTKLVLNELEIAAVAVSADLCIQSEAKSRNLGTIILQRKQVAVGY